MFGWKPKETKAATNNTVPLCFGLVNYNYDEVIRPDSVVYLGPRYKSSTDVHSRYANKTEAQIQVKREGPQLEVSVV